MSNHQEGGHASLAVYDLLIEAVKGAPDFGAATRTLGEDRSARIPQEGMASSERGAFL
ncbi:MAG: hypothetical protein JO356_17265 [Acidobacteria bacterium]|nr:hypothetical protein [Acidobacteriota bacterium]